MEEYVNTPEMQRLRKEDYKEFRKRYHVFRQHHGIVMSATMEKTID